VTPSKSLVLFDIDGTLLRNAGAHHKRSLIEGIRRVTGIPTTLDGVPTSGMLDHDLIAYMLRASGCSERRIRRGLKEIILECQSAYLAGCTCDLQANICPGVRETLTELKARGAALGVVTGNLSQIGWRKLELAGIRHYFSVGAFAEDGTTRTRLAKIAMLRAKKEFASTSCRVSLIGDHGNDIEAAKKNGFQSIGVATGLTSIEELRAAQPDILIRDLTELEIEKLL